MNQRNPALGRSDERKLLALREHVKLNDLKLDPGFARYFDVS